MVVRSVQEEMVFPVERSAQIWTLWRNWRQRETNLRQHTAISKFIFFWTLKASAFHFLVFFPFFFFWLLYFFLSREWILAGVGRFSTVTKPIKTHHHLIFLLLFRQQSAFTTSHCTSPHSFLSVLHNVAQRPPHPFQAHGCHRVSTGPTLLFIFVLDVLVRSAQERCYIDKSTPSNSILASITAAQTVGTAAERHEGALIGEKVL